MPSRVTIAGDIGSGKTTVARQMGELLGVEPLSTGGIQRRLAQARGVSVLELNRLAEADGSIDQEIDSYLMNLPPGNLVVESRMAWNFVPDTLKVYLYVSDNEAARRIVGAQRSDEDYRQVADPLDHILARRRSEVLRFGKYYNVDIDDLNNYDVVIDTTFASAAEIVDVISRQEPSSEKPVCWIDPRNLVPTRVIADLGVEKLTAVQGGARGREFDAEQKVVTLFVDHVFYILDGHARVAAAVRNGEKFIPSAVAASNDQPHSAGTSARQFVREAVRDALIRDWERAIGFEFRDQIWKGRVGREARSGAIKDRAAG